MAMAIVCGVAPPGAVKANFKPERRIGKTLGLAMLYGGAEPMLMRNTGMQRGPATDLLHKQRATFPDFYAWSDVYAYKGLSGAPLVSITGWRFWPRYWPRDGSTPDRTCRNFPVQSVGADIMRIAGCLALLAGIRICAIIHDAFVIEATIEDIDSVTQKMKEIMEYACYLVIGVKIPAKPYIVRHGEPFIDEDGEEDFKMLMSMLEALEGEQEAA
jgi:DNA polymerase I-like protein with 3'-5' exonuclease and polymerase domains